MDKLVAELNQDIAKVREGGGAIAKEKHLSRGKLLVRDRINALIDPGSPFLELSQMAGLIPLTFLSSFFVTD